MDKTPLVNEDNKDGFVYARMDRETLSRIDVLNEKKGFKNRSQAIRSLISWSLKNGLTQLTKTEKPKRQKRSEGERDEVIYTRIEKSILSRIDTLKQSGEFDNRSHCVKSIIAWAFENGVENC
jgi:Arc/MetJ-type ribon-helix-helix transcriptional regulator